MLGAAALAFDGLRATGGARDERGPPDRLPDADRQPRGRHAARARGAARGRRRRLRGHAPHAACCSTATGVGGSSSATTSTTSAQRAGELVRADARRRGGRAGLRRRHAAGLRSRASCSSRPASPPGWRSRCCPGRRPRWRRWWPARCPPTAGASPASCRASAPSSSEVLSLARDAGRVRVARAGGGVAGAARRARPRAAGRGLPRADQAPRGVVRGHGRRARRALRVRRRRGARSCSWSAARPSGAATQIGPALDALRRLVDAGAQAAAGRGGRVGADRRPGQPALSRADV